MKFYVSTTTTDPTPVTAVQIYVDHALVYQVSGTGVQASVFMRCGQHYVVVQAWNAAGATYKSGVTINVPSVPMTISSPVAGSRSTSPVTVAASAPASSPVQEMQVYFYGSPVYSLRGHSVNKVLTMASGQHHLVVKGRDAYETAGQMESTLLCRKSTKFLNGKVPRINAKHAEKSHVACLSLRALPTFASFAVKVFCVSNGLKSDALSCDLRFALAHIVRLDIIVEDADEFGDDFVSA